MNMRLLPIALAALTTFSCASSTKNEAKAPPVQVEVDRVMPLAESLDAAAVEVTLLIENPGASAVQVESVDYAFDTKDISGVLKGNVASGAKIEPSQRAELKFKQRIPFPEDKETYQTILEGQTIAFDLSGAVKLSNGDTLSFSRAGEVATPALPRFEVNDVQAARYGTDGVDVTLFLRLINDNIFPVLVQNVSYTVYINDKKIRSETAAVGLRLLGGSAEEYEVSRTIAGKSGELSGDELKEILALGQLSYKVEGKIELSRLTLPFEHVGEIKLATGE